MNRTFPCLFSFVVWRLCAWMELLFVVSFIHRRNVRMYALYTQIFRFAPTVRRIVTVLQGTRASARRGSKPIIQMNSSYWFLRFLRPDGSLRRGRSAPASIVPTCRDKRGGGERAHHKTQNRMLFSVVTRLCFRRIGYYIGLFTLYGVDFLQYIREHRAP